MDYFFVARIFTTKEHITKGTTSGGGYRVEVVDLGGQAEVYPSVLRTNSWLFRGVNLAVLGNHTGCWKLNPC